MGNSADRRKERRLAERITAMLAAKPKKPVDAWLQLGSVVVGIAYWLWPDKTPTTTVTALLLIAACLVHPVWNFWWIDKKLSRRITAEIVLFGVLLIAGVKVWPAPPPVLVPMEFFAVATPAGYSPGTRIDGIRWKEEFSQVTLRMDNVSSEDFDNIELNLSPKTYIINIVQKSTLSNVSFVDSMSEQLTGVFLTDTDGKGKTTTRPPPVSISTDYKVICQRIPDKTPLEISIIVADFAGMGTAKNKDGRPKLFVKKIPNSIKITGHYSVSNKRIEVDQSVPVLK